MKLQTRTPMRRYSGGMTLVEVLIAAVVIAVGLLGIASLQINALQGASIAQNNTKAMDVITNLAERISANPNGVGAYEGALIPVDPCTVAPNAPLPIIERCAMSPDGDVAVVSDCTPDQMALYDLWEVNCSLQSTIPGALLSISCPAPGCEQMNTMNISVTWQVQNRNPAAVSDSTIDHIVSSTILIAFPGDDL